MQNDEQIPTQFTGRDVAGAWIIAVVMVLAILVGSVA